MKIHPEMTDLSMTGFFMNGWKNKKLCVCPEYFYTSSITVISGITPTLPG